MIAVDRLIAYEEGELSIEEVVELFATMIADGSVWNLQGAYGRQAAAFIGSGWITTYGTINHDRIAEDTEC